MTDDQVRDVRQLTRAAGIKPTTTRVHGADHLVLATLAPGERVLVAGGLVQETRPSRPGASRSPEAPAAGGRGGGGSRRWRPVTLARPPGWAMLDVGRTPAQRGDHVLTWLRRALWDVVPRDHRQSPADLRRRQLVTAVFVAIGGLVLGSPLRIEPGSPWFYPATPVLAGVWVVGAFASGPCTSAASTPGPVAPPGHHAGGDRPRARGLFVVGALLVRQVVSSRPRSAASSTTPTAARGPCSCS